MSALNASANYSPCPRDCTCLQCDCTRASIAAFADAINTGFYVNSYTTKQCPTMDGVLENLRQGLQRLEEQREKELEELAAKQKSTAQALGRELTKEELKTFKGKTVFQETMRTLNRLNSSYRRCYWKSGAEMIFPILYGHMTSLLDSLCEKGCVSSGGSMETKARQFNTARCFAGWGR